MVQSFKRFLVEETREIYFTFGRMNPPTVGHEKLLNKIASVAGKSPYKIFLSQSNDPNKNPLSYEQKVKHVRKMFPKHARNVMLNKNVKGVFDAAANIYNQGYTKINMVVGSDRVREFDILLNKYNGKKADHGFYNFESINVISAGERDPDAEGTEGASASKQRDYASENDFVGFVQGVPKSLSTSDAKKLFNDVRSGMGLKESVNFTRHVELDKVSSVREDYVAGNLFEPGDRIEIKESGATGRIQRLGANYVLVSLDDGGVSRQWIDSIIKECDNDIYKYEVNNKKVDAPEWGTPEATKRAKQITPGQNIGKAIKVLSRSKQKFNKA